MKHEKPVQAAAYDSCRESQQQRNHYEILFEDAPIGIVAADRNGMIISTNPWFCQFIGYSEEELRGTHVSAITHPEDMENEQRAIARMLDKGLPSVHIEKRYVRKDGACVWAHLVASSVKGRDGGEPYGLEMVLDITERKRIEEEKNRLLKELQQSLEQVKVLSGLLPICAYCKKIRDDKGYWDQLDKFISKNTNVTFSHGICSDCAATHFPDINLFDE
jgi:PAS domain S-box-containing protein